MTGFSNGTIYADNVDFRGTNNPDPQVVANGQLLIGSAIAPKIRAGLLGSSDGSITWTVGNGTITGQVTGGTSVLKTLTGNSGGAISPTAGNINILTANSTLKFIGLGSTLTTDYNITNLLLGSSGTAITSATESVGLGSGALLSLTSGGANTAIGVNSLSSCTSGAANCAFGIRSLQLGTTGINGCNGFGYQTLKDTTASPNDAFGASTLEKNTSGTENAAFGNASIANKTTGNRNSAFGAFSLYNLSSGSLNTALGYSAGSALTTNDSNNIHIGNIGTIGDNGKIVIGTSGTHTTAFIAGVSGVTVSNPLPVFLNSATGQLGTGSASLSTNDYTQVFLLGGM